MNAKDQKKSKLEKQLRALPHNPMGLVQVRLNPKDGSLRVGSGDSVLTIPNVDEIHVEVSLNEELGLLVIDVGGKAGAHFGAKGGINVVIDGQESMQAEGSYSGRIQRSKARRAS